MNHSRDIRIISLTVHFGGTMTSIKKLLANTTVCVYTTDPDNCATVPDAPQTLAMGTEICVYEADLTLISPSTWEVRRGAVVLIHRVPGSPPMGRPPYVFTDRAVPVSLPDTGTSDPQGHDSDEQD